ncbi:MAG: electron transport complex subunit E [Pseudomonadota bacterium]
MATKTVKELTIDGLWKNNPGVVQLLGLCPLLAVTGSVVNALGMGLATLFVLVLSNITVSVIRNITSNEIRIPAFVMIIAAAVTVVELLTQAYSYELYQILGIFLPLITTNCIILGRAEAFASKNNVGLAAVDGFMMGIGFAAVLLVLGALREVIGTGTLFNNMQLLFGADAENWKLVLFPNYPGLLAAILPPGAFLFMGFIIAFKNIIDQRIERAKAATRPTVTAADRRIRVTGQVS